MLPLGHRLGSWGMVGFGFLPLTDIRNGSWLRRLLSINNP
jgi:hypothetical protein